MFGEDIIVLVYVHRLNTTQHEANLHGITYQSCMKLAATVKFLRARFAAGSYCAFLEEAFINGSVDILQIDKNMRFIWDPRWLLCH